MKILMVLDREFPPDIRVENEIDALTTAGHEVHIACYTRKNKPNIEKLGKLTIHRKSISLFVYKSSVASLTLPFYFRFWKTFLQQTLNDLPFDALHIHDLPLVGIGIQLKKQFKLKLIADLHENWPAFLSISTYTNTFAGRLLSPISLWRNYEKKVLPHADVIIVVVNEAKKRLIELGLESKKIRIVSNTINLGDLNLPSQNITHNEIILYYAGGINYHRGLQNVIRAMHKTENSQLIFWILGEGSYKDKLVSLVNELSLNKRVIFQGYQPFRKVMEMLSESDFTLIPHLKSEHTDSTIPHKLFQYMYAKKPVIASDCLPIKRILEETGSGIVYPHNNIDLLAEIFTKLQNYDSVKMGINGELAVMNKYNWSADSKILVSIYNAFNV